MHYIAMNPATPKVYQSLIKTCKYFFIKNSIIVISNIIWKQQKWGTYYVNGRYQDISDLTKLWIDRQFRVYASANTRNIVSTIIPMLYRFDAKELCLHNQDISYNDYIYLSSSAVDISFSNVIIKDKNGSILAFQKIVEIAAKAKRFAYRSDTVSISITSKTVKKILGNPNFLRFKFFFLRWIPEAFDLEFFYEYMKKNKTTKFDLMFNDTISDAYKARLDAIIDEILGTQVLDYKPPHIYFFGMNHEKYYKLDFL